MLSQSAKKPLYNVRLLAQEYEPDPNWKMPEVPAFDIYDISIFQFKATTLIRYCSVNAPISLGQSVYQIHIGLIQFGINPLVRPGLDTSVLTCIIDSRHIPFRMP